MCLPLSLLVYAFEYEATCELTARCMQSELLLIYLLAVQEAADSWTFSVFDLSDATTRPLSTLAFFLLKVSATLQSNTLQKA